MGCKRLKTLNKTRNISCFPTHKAMKLYKGFPKATRVQMLMCPLPKLPILPHIERQPRITREGIPIQKRLGLFHVMEGWGCIEMSFLLPILTLYMAPCSNILDNKVGQPREGLIGQTRNSYDGINAQKKQGN